MLTVSIVVHNTPAQQLEKALECLSRSEVSKIYIIENSEKPLFEGIEKKYDNIEYRYVENKGYGAGHNVALKEVLTNPSDGYHLVMNSDITWEGDVITPLIQYMEQNQDVGLVVPKIYYPDGSLQYACRKLPTPTILILRRFFPGKFIRKPNEHFLLVEHNHDYPLNCPYLSGCFLMFRTEALRGSGIFDERFFMYPEDIDITRRVHENWKTMYWPKVAITHEHQASSRKNFKMLCIHITNMIRYFNKWGWWNDKQRKLFNQRLMQEISRGETTDKSL